nr:class I SAM-dependent methyltransferase [Bacteroidota bacterium]
MRFSTFFSKQARKPTGIFGRFYMSRVFEKGNLEMNTFTKETLSINKDEYILEIGCGTGLLLKEIANDLDKGFIEGIDFSKTMVSIARKKNKKHINNKKVIIQVGDFDEFIFKENYYDKIYSVNTIYFWKNPIVTISKIFDLLKPNGMLVLGFHDKVEMEEMNLNEDIFQLYSSKDVIKLLSIDGKLNNVEIISKRGLLKINYCAIGIKSI